jgi:hypothetical protein
MQAASEAAESGMVSVIGLDIETVEKLCARTRELTGASARARARGGALKADPCDDIVCR